MNAIQTNMLEFIQQAKQQFIIPVYQRTYKWTRLNCKQLLDDIIRVSNTPNKTHFIGSIVYITDEHYQATKLKKLNIIDGQQRITTISLLLLAMAKYIEENPNEFETTSDELYKEYLINETYKIKYGKDYIKLSLTKHDKSIYDKLVKKDLIDDVSHNIYSNFKYFYEAIKRYSLNIDKLYDGIARLVVVDVSLVRTQDDPQLIFESLNSTGVKLTQADLIRNYLLMDLEPEFQNRIYTDYWFDIEQKLQNDKEELSEFIRDYLTIKHEKIPNKSDVYAEFKKYFSNNYKRTPENIELFIKELFAYSSIYKKIIHMEEDSIEINKYFSDFNELDLKVTNPLLMKFYYDYKESIISKDELVHLLCLIESCLIRRIICNAPTNSLGKIFLNLIKNVKASNYIDTAEKILMSKDGNQRFPKNDEFKSIFLLKDIYNLKPTVRRFILNKIENSSSKEIINIDAFSIEHIMPQSTNLSDKWVNALGSEWKEVHNKYLHTIGNLSLTRYNSEMGNKFFTEKRDIEGGYKDSSCWLNRDLKSLDTWNETEIIKRANRLIEKALTIWPSPQVEDSQNNYNVILDFEDEWRGKKPKYFTFMDEKHEIKDITNLYTTIINLMYDFDPEVFMDAINTEEVILKRMFSTDENSFHGNSPQLSNTTLYINTNYNSDAKKNNILLLIKTIGFSEEDFIIYL